MNWVIILSIAVVTMLILAWKMPQPAWKQETGAGYAGALTTAKANSPDGNAVYINNFATLPECEKAAMAASPPYGGYTWYNDGGAYNQGCYGIKDIKIAPKTVSPNVFSGVAIGPNGEKFVIDTSNLQIPSVVGNIGGKVANGVQALATATGAAAVTFANTLKLGSQGFSTGNIAYNTQMAGYMKPTWSERI